MGAPSTARFRRSVRETLARRRLFSSGERVLVAVSGGADSMALLHVLHGLSRTLHLRLSVGHVDHRMRPESAEDGARVEAFARALELPFASRILSPPPSRGTGEALARAGRLAALEAMADDVGASSIALAHTATDRAETFLLFAARGAGRRGLASMRARVGRRVRPLCEVTRDEVRAYALAAGLPFADDPTNAERSRARNRVRLDVLPALRAINPEVERHLSALAEDFEDDEAWLDAQAQAFLSARGAIFGEGLASVPAAAAAELSPAIAARAFEALWLRAVGAGAPLLGRRQRRSIAALAAREGFGRVALSGGEATREGAALVLRRARPQRSTTADEVPIRVDGPGPYAARGGGINFTVSLLDSAELSPSPAAARFDASQVSFPLWIRPPKPGDRIALRRGGRQEVAEILKDGKVPRSLRAGWLVVADDRGVLWVPGLRQCQGRAASARSRFVLQIQVRGLMFDDPYVKQLETRVAFP